MRKLSTGEPYAGKLHVRFGGRGEPAVHSDPYRQTTASVRSTPHAAEWPKATSGAALLPTALITGVYPESAKNCFAAHDHWLSRQIMPTVYKYHLSLNHFCRRAGEEFDEADVVVVLHRSAAGILLGGGLENFVCIGAEHSP